LLEIAHLHERQGSAITFGSSRVLSTPRLTVERPGKREEFFSSVVALVRGPAAPRNFHGDPFFRDCSITAKFPRLGFAAAVAIQVILIAYPPPIWRIQPSRATSTAAPLDVTWYGPAKDFPAIVPATRAPRTASRKDDLTAPTHQDVQAFHPRQTILSEPLHPTHPRQVLLQPRSLLKPPTILPALPNIVQLAMAEPQRPKPQLTTEDLAALRPKTRASFLAPNVAAPEIQEHEKQTGLIDIASSPQSALKPVLPVNPMSAPRAAQHRDATTASVPEIWGGAGSGETLIALSAAAPPVAAPPAIPAGNLSARISISPEGPQPDSSGGVASGIGEASGGGGGHGPEGIFIRGGVGASSRPKPGTGSAARGPDYLTPLMRVPSARATPDQLEAAAELAASARVALDAEKMLGSKRVFTLLVSMPNFTSTSGNWVLNFAELSEEAQSGAADLGGSDLGGPVPLRKVDPKYPPELRNSHVDGEVILHAIIRKDGSVDSIQLVRSVDPRLDANAMEALAQWKFSPGEKHGEPVDLEAVVHIPFRSRNPAF
jgi:TonB family protein